MPVTLGHGVASWKAYARGLVVAQVATQGARQREGPSVR